MEEEEEDYKLILLQNHQKMELYLLLLPHQLMNHLKNGHHLKVILE
jgi:hypothetical protein